MAFSLVRLFIMFKKILSLVLLGILVFSVWAFVQYKQVAEEAEAQILIDVEILKKQLEEKKLNRQAPFNDEYHESLKLVESRLTIQSVNEQQQFVRHYRSLFIHQGHTRCLLSKMIYPQRQGTVLSQQWLPEGTDCLPF